MQIMINGADTAQKRTACYSAIEQFLTENHDEMEYHFSDDTYGLECLVTVHKRWYGLRCKIITQGNL